VKPETAEPESQRPSSLPPDGGADEFQLSRSQQRLLLQLARLALAEFLHEGSLPEVQVADPILSQPAGVFVTLRKRRLSLGDSLRGCVGRMEAELPLYRGVQEMAVKAALADPRFQPMSADELPGVRIEISVLTQPRRLEHVEDIKIGRDGLLIQYRGHRGVLLPKVAEDRRWSRLQFLQCVCQKAGLPPDSWRAGAELYVFTSIDFGEDE